MSAERDAVAAIVAAGGNLGHLTPAEFDLLARDVIEDHRPVLEVLAEHETDGAS